MLLAGYASDSDSDAESSTTKPHATAIAATSAGAPISAAVASRPKKRSAPVRITLDLPKVADDEQAGISGKVSARGGDGQGDGGNSVEAPPAKRGKGIQGGKGSSTLLGMLPPPKRKLPTSTIADRKSSLTVNKSMATAPVAPAQPVAQDATSEERALFSLRPTLAPPVESAPDEAQELDIFGLGSVSTSLPSRSATVAPPASLTVKSAPDVASFVPPEPSSSDPYPGYYQLPSGQWAAYDAAFYQSFFPSTADPRNTAADEGRMGKGWADLASSSTDFIDVRVDDGLAEGRAEEDRKARMQKPKLPGDEFVYQPIGQTKGVASDRHQLSSLLNTAFSQREALEERIAQNKKSARMARTKYGF